MFIAIFAFNITQKFRPGFCIISHPMTPFLDLSQNDPFLQEICHWQPFNLVWLVICAPLSLTNVTSPPQPPFIVLNLILNITDYRFIPSHNMLQSANWDLFPFSLAMICAYFRCSNIRPFSLWISSPNAINIRCKVIKSKLNCNCHICVSQIIDGKRSRWFSHSGFV